jgi:DnaJ-class molecular chaperone
MSIDQQYHTEFERTEEEEFRDDGFVSDICEACDGTGMKNGHKCKLCGGKG